jgi:hypothetical protein
MDKQSATSSNAPYVRCGSLSEVNARIGEVRSPSDSGHHQPGCSGPISANKRQGRRYRRGRSRRGCAEKVSHRLREHSGRLRGVLDRLAIFKRTQVKESD